MTTAPRTSHAAVLTANGCGSGGGAPVGRRDGAPYGRPGPAAAGRAVTGGHAPGVLNVRHPRGISLCARSQLPATAMSTVRDLIRSPAVAARQDGRPGATGSQ